MSELDQIVFFYWLLCINEDFVRASDVFDRFLKGRDISKEAKKQKIIQLLYHGLSLDLQLGVLTQAQREERLKALEASKD